MTSKILATLSSDWDAFVSFLEQIGTSEVSTAISIGTQVIAESPEVLTAPKPLVALGQLAAGITEKALANSTPVSSNAAVVAATQIINTDAAKALLKIAPAAA